MPREQVAGDLLPADSLAERQRRLVATTVPARQLESGIADKKKHMEMVSLTDSSTFRARLSRPYDSRPFSRWPTITISIPIPTRDSCARGNTHSSNGSSTKTSRNGSKWPLPLEPASEEVSGNITGISGPRCQCSIKSLRQPSRASAAQGLTSYFFLLRQRTCARIAWMTADATRGRMAATRNYQLTLATVTSRYPTAAGNKTLNVFPSRFAGLGKIRCASGLHAGGNLAEKVPVTCFSVRRRQDD